MNQTSLSVQNAKFLIRRCLRKKCSKLTELRKINMEQYLLSPTRYKLVNGDSEGVPLCPYGNHYQWIGLDLIWNRMNTFDLRNPFLSYLYSHFTKLSYTFTSLQSSLYFSMKSKCRGSIWYAS